MTNSRQTVQSVERALRILECFTLEKSELVLGEIAKKTGLSKSTVFRLLSTLSGSGYIKQDAVTQKYSLDIKLFHLGAVVIGNIPLRSTALPYMQKLSEDTLENVHLNIFNGDERVCIELVESAEVIRNFVKVGERNNLCSGATGRVILAFFPENEQQQIISRTIQNNNLQMDIDIFREKLAIIRQHGYAFSKDEKIIGAFSIAAPLFDCAGKIVGAISAAGPTQRLTEERTRLLIELVVETAKKISEPIPAVLYYLGIFLQVHFRAKKTKWRA